MVEKSYLKEKAEFLDYYEVEWLSSVSGRPVLEVGDIVLYSITAGGEHRTFPDTEVVEFQILEISKDKTPTLVARYPVDRLEEALVEWKYRKEKKSFVSFYDKKCWEDVGPRMEPSIYDAGEVFNRLFFLAELIVRDAILCAENDFKVKLSNNKKGKLFEVIMEDLEDHNCWAIESGGLKIFHPSSPHFENGNLVDEEFIVDDIREDKWLVSRYHEFNQYKGEGLSRFLELSSVLASADIAEQQKKISAGDSVRSVGFKR